MKLVSFTMAGRDDDGVVGGQGVVSLGKRFADRLRDLLAARGLAAADE